jgi:hypothetical protein
MPMNADYDSTRNRYSGHASALLSVYPEGVNKVVARCILLGEDPEFIIRH